MSRQSKEINAAHFTLSNAGLTVLHEWFLLFDITRRVVTCSSCPPFWHAQVSYRGTCFFCSGAFWHVLPSGHSSWTSCSSPGKQIASLQCESSGVSAARPTWWNSCRRTASCTQTAALRSATSGAPWGEKFCHKLSRNPVCDKCAVSFCQARRSTWRTGSSDTCISCSAAQSPEETLCAAEPRFASGIAQSPYVPEPSPSAAGSDAGRERKSGSHGSPAADSTTEYPLLGWGTTVSAAGAQGRSVLWQNLALRAGLELGQRNWQRGHRWEGRWTAWSKVTSSQGRSHRGTKGPREGWGAVRGGSWRSSGCAQTTGAWIVRK